jgi:response regulator RpfG family c-di-GMP phosphodiesterase
VDAPLDARPLLAARIGLARFAGVTTAYDQTIRAMSRLPEQLGTVEPDHGVRVGQLAREVAHELGADATSALEVEQAAYLHELGHIQIEAEEQPTRAELAQAGSEDHRLAG